MCVQMRKIRFFGGIFDEPPIQDQPKYENARRDEKYRPNRVDRLPFDRKHRPDYIVQPKRSDIRFYFRHVHDGLAPVEGKIDSEGNQGSEDCAEHPALTHMK